MFNVLLTDSLVLFSASLDREDEDLYALAVLAVDQGQPPLTGQAIVYVQVTDVNDKSPYFVPTVPEGEIVENSQANTPVAHLNLNSRTFDDDIAPNQVRFFLKMLWLKRRCIPEKCLSLLDHHSSRETTVGSI